LTRTLMCARVGVLDVRLGELLAVDPHAAVRERHLVAGQADHALDVVDRRIRADYLSTTTSPRCTSPEHVGELIDGRCDRRRGCRASSSCRARPRGGIATNTSPRTRPASGPGRRGSPDRAQSRERAAQTHERGLGAVAGGGAGSSRTGGARKELPAASGGPTRKQLGQPLRAPFAAAGSAAGGSLGDRRPAPAAPSGSATSLSESSGTGSMSDLSARPPDRLDGARATCKKAEFSPFRKRGRGRKPRAPNAHMRALRSRRPLWKPIAALVLAGAPGRGRMRGHPPARLGLGAPPRRSRPNADARGDLRPSPAPRGEAPTAAALFGRRPPGLLFPQGGRWRANEKGERKFASEICAQPPDRYGRAPTTTGRGVAARFAAATQPESTVDPKPGRAGRRASSSSGATRATGGRPGAGGGGGGGGAGAGGGGGGGLVGRGSRAAQQGSPHAPPDARTHERAPTRGRRASCSLRSGRGQSRRSRGSRPKAPSAPPGRAGAWGAVRKTSRSERTTIASSRSTTARRSTRFAAARAGPRSRRRTAALADLAPA
jgi:hypothetical protein